jgi:hypothetical protein
MMNPGTIRARGIARLPAASRRYAAGRVCSEPGCGTVLSVYNRDATCYAHTPRRTPRLRGRTAPAGRRLARSDRRDGAEPGG